MEQNKRIKILMMCAIVLFSVLPVKAGIVFPEDTPTIEALIDAHKKMQKAERLALAEITAISETHSLTEKATEAFNKTKTVLNKRLGDGMSYLKLVTEIISVGVKLESLIENYADFTKTTYKYALKKPYVMIYYTRAHNQLIKEVDHIQKLVASFAATEVLDILKATPEEQYQMLMQINLSIGRMNRIIWNNDLICRSMIINGLRIYHIEDIFGKETQELVTAKLVAKWYKEQGVEL